MYLTVVLFTELAVQKLLSFLVCEGYSVETALLNAKELCKLTRGNKAIKLVEVTWKIELTKHIEKTEKTLSKQIEKMRDFFSKSRISYVHLMLLESSTSFMTMNGFIEEESKTKVKTRKEGNVFLLPFKKDEESEIIDEEKN